MPTYFDDNMFDQQTVAFGHADLDQPFYNGTMNDLDGVDFGQNNGQYTYFEPLQATSSAPDTPDQPDQPDQYFVEADDECDRSEKCYAKLIYECLREAPDYSRPLKEIYNWVHRNSAKAREDPCHKGWQNSVRHNLSMNHAFVKVRTHPPQKKTSLWKLSDEALALGHVISTTRYRNNPKRKKSRNAVTSQKRVDAGAKGGKATRDAQRRIKELRNRHDVRDNRGHRQPPIGERWGTIFDPQQPSHPAYMTTPYPSAMGALRSSPQPMMATSANHQFFEFVPQYTDMPQQQQYQQSSYPQPLVQQQQAYYKIDEPAPIQTTEDQHNLTFLDAPNNALFADTDSPYSSIFTGEPSLTPDTGFEFEDEDTLAGGSSSPHPPFTYQPGPQ